MKNSVWAKAKIAILFFGLIFGFAQIFSVELQAQKRRKPASRAAAATKKKPVPKKAAARVNPNLPKVTQIDAAGLQNLLKRGEGESAKPLLINFWATWCEPCREEFPDLVKIDEDYKGKIDFITISLDYLSEINGDVPKFLAEMKAAMPAYLLKTENESEAIALVSKDWQGGLPFTILFDAKGAEAYQRQGKIKVETVRAQIDKLLVPPTAENKDKPKISSETMGAIVAAADEKSGARDFYRKPFDDFGAKFNEAILKNEINPNAPFSVKVIGEIDENGKLIDPIRTIKPGSDEKMAKFAGEFITALSDSQMLRYLNDFGARQIIITLAQDENNFGMIIESETESENRARAVVSMLNLFTKQVGFKEGSDEAFLVSKTQMRSAGKSFSINFSMSREEKNQTIEKYLKRFREKSKNN
ncbi:MAG: TlpA family protein disulfide reductase [Acidobacteriota bacterium]|nr:TlpA family protein disulfide reductase [Acidobacteriota bacterium]